MNYNVGDKLLCKKSYLHYIKGKSYKLERIYREGAGSNIFEIYVFSEDNAIKSMRLTKNKVMECFYTLEEERKLKIEKIRNGN